MSTRDARPNAPCPCGSGKKRKKCCSRPMPVEPRDHLPAPSGRVLASLLPLLALGGLTSMEGK